VSVTVRVVRRFQSKGNGVSTIVRLVKDLELPTVPVRDMPINAADGTPEMIAWTTRLHARGSTPPAVSLPRVEVGTKTEDGAGLDAALAAGWAPVSESE